MISEKEIEKRKPINLAKKIINSTFFIKYIIENGKICLYEPLKQFNAHFLSMHTFVSRIKINEC